MPNAVGRCAGDIGVVAADVNAAQERLITCPEAGDTGWWGSYAEIAFTATRSNPYFTGDRSVARLIRIDACDFPYPLANQFQEYLDFGSGRWPKLVCGTTNVCRTGPQTGFRRNVVPTFADLVPPNKGIRVYTNAADNGLKTLISGLDANSQPLFDVASGARGCFATFAAPFTDLKLAGSASALVISVINGIQKDATTYPVNFYEVDLVTGAQRLLLTMEPGEQVSGYPRYYLNGLPDGCCRVPGVPVDTNTINLTAMVKLALVPARVDTDYLLIQSIEAILAEVQSARFADMDSAGAKAQSAERHRQAVRFLQGELIQHEGKDKVAVGFYPFGGARLTSQAIGLLQ